MKRNMYAIDFMNHFSFEKLANWYFNSLYPSQTQTFKLVFQSELNDCILMGNKMVEIKNSNV